MTNELFMRLAYLILLILASIITGCVVPWIKSKITAAQLQEIETWTEKAVRAAEQLYTKEEWAEKKNYVFDYIVHRVNATFGLTLSLADIDLLIEGVVNEVKKG